MEITENSMIGEIVVFDYRCAAVFQSFGIDFCYKGNRTLIDVCEKRDIEVDILIADLKLVMVNTERFDFDYGDVPVNFITDHIKTNRPFYVSEKILMRTK